VSDTLTYQQLHREVQKFANDAEVAWREVKGEPASLSYMGACSASGAYRHGWAVPPASPPAAHTAHTGGSSEDFSARTRWWIAIHDSEASARDHARRILPRRAPKSKLFPAVEEALRSCPSVKNVIVLPAHRVSDQRAGRPGPLVARVDGESF